MLACHVLDDRPPTCNVLKKYLRDANLDAKITANAKRWGERVGIIGGDASLKQPPIVIDKNLHNIHDLSDLGRPDIKTTGEDAGWLILSKIIIPLIDKGMFVNIPIALVSAREIERERENFRGLYSNKYSNVHFFSKLEEEGEGAREALRFVEQAIENDKTITMSETDQAFLTVLNDVQSSLGISDSDIFKIFGIEEETLFDTDFATAILQLKQNIWHKRTITLLEIRDSLVTIFSNTGNPENSAINWLKSERIGNSELTAYEMLLSGSDSSVHKVADSAAFFIDYE